MVHIIRRCVKLFLSIVLFVLVVQAGSRKWKYPARYYEWVNDTFVNGTVELQPNAPARSPTFETDLPVERWKNRGTAGQDLLLLDVFNDKSKGYFVDLAANQYQDSSNTYLVEYFNRWRGVCIEANPIYHTELLGYRRCMLFINPAYSKENEVIHFRGKSKGGAGIVGESFMNKNEDPSDLTLTTVTLEKILSFAQAPSIIDYLSLDIEGAEFDALKNFPFHKYLFLIMTVERPSHHLHSLLSHHGYHFVRTQENFGDAVYFHRALPDFHAMMVRLHNPEVPEWFGEKRVYLLHPRYPSFLYADESSSAAEISDWNNVPIGCWKGPISFKEYCAKASREAEDYGVILRTLS